MAAGAAEIGVATLGEALALRRDGITAPVLAWLHPPGTDFTPALSADVQIAVSSARQLADLLDAVARTGAPRVTVKVDTGLNRNGVSANEYPGAADGAGRPRPTTRSGSAASCRTWPAATIPTSRSMTFRRSGLTEHAGPGRVAASTSRWPTCPTRPRR